MALNKKFTRSSAEAAPGNINTETNLTSEATIAGTATRNNAKTVVKSFSIRTDVYQGIERYLYDHHERSASKVVNLALEEFLHAKGY